MPLLDYYRNPSDFVNELVTALASAIKLSIKPDDPLSHADDGVGLYYSVGDSYPVTYRNDGLRWHELEIQFHAVGTGSKAELQILDLSTRIEREIDNHLLAGRGIVDAPQIVSNTRDYTDVNGAIKQRSVTCRHIIALGTLNEATHQILGVKS